MWFVYSNSHKKKLLFNKCLKYWILSEKENGFEDMTNQKGHKSIHKKTKTSGEERKEDINERVGFLQARREGLWWGGVVCVGKGHDEGVSVWKSAHVIFMSIEKETFSDSSYTFSILILQIL